MNMRRSFSVRNDYLGIGKKDIEKMECDLHPLLISYEDDCKLDSTLHGYDNTLKSMINNALEDRSYSTNGGLETLDICGRSITALSYSNQIALDGISSFKATLRNKKSKITSWRKTRKNEERVNLLADQYIKNSGELLEFVAEMEGFQRKARDSCTFIKREIEKYHQMKNHVSGRGYYSRVLEILNDLTASNNIYEPSTSSLLARLHSITKNQTVMLDNLTEQQRKIGKRQDLTPWLRRAKNVIFMGTMACMVVAAIVTAALGALPVAGVITSLLPSAAGGGHWLRSWLIKFRDSANFKMDLNDCMLQGTWVTNKELGNIKFLIQRVVNEINSLMFSPSSMISEGQIESTMKHVEVNLQRFMRQIVALEKETDKFSNEILKARDEVLICRDR